MKKLTEKKTNNNSSENIGNEMDGDFVFSETVVVMMMLISNNFLVNSSRKRKRKEYVYFNNCRKRKGVRDVRSEGVSWRLRKRITDLTM